MLYFAGLCRGCLTTYCALMKVKIDVKLKRYKGVIFVDDVDTIINAIKRNPFYFFDVTVTDLSSTLYPEKHVGDDITNPFFE